MLINKLEKFVWYSTCLKNNFLAPNTCSLQVNESPHLLGPRMLSNETVTGLMEKSNKKTEQRVSERENKNVAEEIRQTKKDGTFFHIKWQPKVVTTGLSDFQSVKHVFLSLHFTWRIFSSAPLKRKITPWWRGVDWLAREWRTSSITAQLTASSLAPKTRKPMYVCQKSTKRKPAPTCFSHLNQATEAQLRLAFTHKDMRSFTQITCLSRHSGSVWD